MFVQESFDKDAASWINSVLDTFVHDYLVHLDDLSVPQSKRAATATEELLASFSGVVIWSRMDVALGGVVVEGSITRGANTLRQLTDEELGDL